MGKGALLKYQSYAMSQVKYFMHEWDWGAFLGVLGTNGYGNVLQS